MKKVHHPQLSHILQSPKLTSRWIKATSCTVERLLPLIVCAVFLVSAGLSSVPRVLDLSKSAISLAQSAQEIYFATWNVENLFDDSDDPGTHDNEVMTWWNTALYQNKLTRLAEIIAQMNGGKGPDILALVEVENATVITDLGRILPAPTSYTMVHVEGEASRGMEVGLITRFPVISKSSERSVGGLILI